VGGGGYCVIIGCGGGGRREHDTLAGRDGADHVISSVVEKIIQKKEGRHEDKKTFVDQEGRPPFSFERNLARVEMTCKGGSRTGLDLKRASGSLRTKKKKKKAWEEEGSKKGGSN